MSRFRVANPMRVTATGAFAGTVILLVACGSGGGQPTPIDSADYEDVYTWKSTDEAWYYWTGFIDGLLCAEAGLQAWPGGDTPSSCPEQSLGVDGRAAFAIFHGRAIGGLAPVFCEPGDGAWDCEENVWQGLGVDEPPRPPPDFQPDPGAGGWQPSP